MSISVSSYSKIAFQEYTQAYVSKYSTYYNRDRKPYNFGLSGEQPVKDKWIYMYEKDFNGHELWKIYADKDGKYTVKEIPEDAMKYDSEEERQALSRPSDTLPFTVVGDIAFWMSAVELSDERLEELISEIDMEAGTRTGSAKIPERMLTTNYYDPNRERHIEGYDTKIIKLIDFFAVGEYLNKQYVKERDDCIEWVTERALKKSVSDIVHNLVSNDRDLRDYLESNGYTHERWRRDYIREEERQTREFQNYGAAIVEWFGTKGFRSWSEDYDYLNTPEHAKEIADWYYRILRRVSESKIGLDYMTEELNNEDSIFVKMLDPDFGKKVQDSMVKVIDFLANPIIRQKGGNAVQYIYEVLRISGYQGLNVTTTNFALAARTGNVNVPIPKFEAQAIDIADVGADKVRNIAILRGTLELINVTVTAYKLHEAMQKHAIDDPETIKSVLTFIAAIGDATELALTVTNVATREIGKRAIAWIGGVAAALNAVVDGWNAYDQYAEGDTDAAVGMGLSALGNGMVAAGSIMCLSVALAPAGAIIALAGVIISIFGSLIAMFGDDSPVEEWLKFCTFGEDHGDYPRNQEREWFTGKFSDWHNNPQKQIEAFHSLIKHLEKEKAKAEAEKQARERERERIRRRNQERQERRRKFHQNRNNRTAALETSAGSGTELASADIFSAPGSVEPRTTSLVAEPVAGRSPVLPPNMFS